ncbi:hypothetical protein GGG16DRAFT_93158 [Schizophyllum commune]
MLDKVTLDVVIHIQAFLSPLDILLNLRQTCKRLYHATHIRTVWLEAARRTCVQNFVFLPSFPIGRMSQSELEHLATSPERYRAILARGAEEDCLEPYVRRTLVPRRVDHCTHKFLELMLIPGGRYLFALAKTAVYLWDLGTNANKMILPRPLAVKAFEETVNDDVFCAGATPIGSKVLFLLGYSVENGVKHVAYEVDPCAASPQIEEIGSLTRNHSDVRVGTIYDGRLAFWSDEGSEVGLWHLRSGTTITWDVPKIQEMIFIEDSATCCCDDRIDVFNLKKLLSPTSKPVTEHFPELTPVLSLPHTIDVVQRMFRWYTQDPHLMFFDTLDLSTSKTTFSRFRLQATPPGDVNLPSFVPVFIESIDLTPEIWKARLDRSCTNLKLLDEDVCFAWTKGEYEQLGVHMGRSSPAERQSFATRLLSDGEEAEAEGPQTAANEGNAEDIPDFDFCPASGRLALLTDDFEITVLDYLMPPTC